MTKITATISRGLRFLDLFPSSKLVRYNGETEYTSTTGGLVSAVVITIFIVLFASMGLKTVKKEIIQSSVATTNQVIPPELIFNSSP